MIRFATYDDIGRIMDFIDAHWKKGHIMARDKELFEFQHLWGNEVSFVLSERGGKIEGVLGYIPYGRHGRDVTLAIWKALKTDDTMLGVKILHYLRQNGQVRALAAPGINPKTRAVYQFLGLHTGTMKQWYRLRKGVSWQIAKVADDEIPDYMPQEEVLERLENEGDSGNMGHAGSLAETNLCGKEVRASRLTETSPCGKEVRASRLTETSLCGKEEPPGRLGQLRIEDLSDFAYAMDRFLLADCLERPGQLVKSAAFIARRYYRHPVFSYKKMGLTCGEKRLFLVLRIQQCGASRALRLIDCIGDHALLPLFTPKLDELLVQWDCEYADCYEAGIDEAAFRYGGWKLRQETENIIPEYFSPFEQKNVTIYYMSEDAHTVLFKGDGDMDRPN